MTKGATITVQYTDGEVDVFKSEDQDSVIFYGTHRDTDQGSAAVFGHKIALTMLLTLLLDNHKDLVNQAIRLHISSMMGDIRSEERRTQ